jgi:rifampin ADP-ribosylating transferase
MEFDPRNNIVKLCIQGMALEDNGKPEEALNVFLQAWNEATNDFEKYLAAHFVARQQKEIHEKLRWLETSLQFALKVNNHSVTGALPSLYLTIAKCYEELGEQAKADKNHELSISSAKNISDNGPFYHGTKADLKVGDMLTAGAESNYKSDLMMNHIYFTALPNGAGLAAALAKGEGRERVYIVEPTGSFENDPNVTDKNFPAILHVPTEVHRH